MCMGFCTDGFTPGGRSGHESVLIGNKLYIMGGLIQYYKIQHLTSTSPMLYGISKGAALAGGITKSHIFLIGEARQDIKIPHWNMTDQFVYVYYENSQIWEIVKGAQPTRRSSTSVAIDQFGVAYIFGGKMETDMASDADILYNELYSFDTETLL
ncbi:hypothetical protein C2G38_2218549 [Gigaspora rosea]|uniref:Uncharacterized protein n=1 Tax=Gigaspora rosea TaxID=44941 RepID=A0A397U9W5_9GLOM|nr:hypothetical protein C2G38_2218549 [Gigaspora rosea]